MYIFQTFAVWRYTDNNEKTYYFVLVADDIFRGHRLPVVRILNSLEKIIEM